MIHYKNKKKGEITLDYVIATNNQKTFIRLNDSGTPVTCGKNDSQRFEYSKARNIVEHLPKTLKKFHFKVQAVPEIPKKKEPLKEESIEEPVKMCVINNKSSDKEEYSPSENVTRWIDKFGSCADTITEAREREKSLLAELRKKDDEIIDILHIIEIEKPKDLYKGWILYKRIKKNRKERRDIKDELLIVENVLDSLTDVSCLHRKNVKRAVNGLFNRQYTFRVVENSSDS